MAKLPSGYKVKDGKVIKTPGKKSVSQRISERKNPRKKYVPKGQQN